MCTKTKYLRCNFSGTKSISELELTLGGKVVASTSKFIYLGSVIQRNREIDEDVTHRIQAGWLKWRATIGVLCDIKFPSRLKGKFYRVTIRPILLYKTECWPKKMFQNGGWKLQNFI